MRPEVSICIPVFESEEYLEICLESTARQNFKKMEILVCDDCSNGKNQQGKSCKEIVKEFKKKNRRLKVEYIRHDVNKGLVEVRRTLVYYAKGKYIFNLDSDDYLADDAIITLYEKAVETDSDIVHGSSKSFFVNQNGDFEIDENKKNLVVEGELLDKQIFNKSFVEKEYSTFLWGKLIRREVYLEALNLIPPTYCNMAEDILQYFFISRFAKKYVGINHCVYFYRTNTGMTSNKKMIRDLYQWELICSTASVFSILFTWNDDQNESDKLAPEELLAVQKYSYHYIGNNIIQLKKAVVPELQEQARKVLCEYWGENFVNRVEKEIDEHCI